MITEVFLTRYPTPIFNNAAPPTWVNPFLAKLTHVFVEDILPLAEDGESFCRDIHQRLSREMGVLELESGATFADRCIRFLSQGVNMQIWYLHSTDQVLKSRLSLIELALRRCEAQLAGKAKADDILGGLLSWSPTGKTSGSSKLPTAAEIRGARLEGVVSEVNARLKMESIPIEYHAGYLQLVDDQLTQATIVAPFWEAISEPFWKNVALDMQEAIATRDSGGRDAALYAAKALESAIKIVSDARGLTRGTERGAADFVDNLVSAKNGRLIDPWEADSLKFFFSKIRNPHGHGPGTAPMPDLDAPQERWVIEHSMSWIKRLVHLMPSRPSFP